MLPEFDERGYLPPGVHACGWEELRARFGFNTARGWLLTQLEEIATLASRVGGVRLYIDGSFVTRKETPVDVDVVHMMQRDVDPLEPGVQHLYGEASLRQIDLFVVAESDHADLADWLDFFGSDRAEIQRGIVRVDL